MPTSITAGRSMPARWSSGTSRTRTTAAAAIAAATRKAISGVSAPTIRGRRWLSARSVRIETDSAAFFRQVVLAPARPHIFRTARLSGRRLLRPAAPISIVAARSRRQNFRLASQPSGDARGLHPENLLSQIRAVPALSDREPEVFQWMDVSDRDVEVRATEHAGNLAQHDRIAIGRWREEVAIDVGPDLDPAEQHIEIVQLETFRAHPTVDDHLTAESEAADEFPCHGTA